MTKIPKMPPVVSKAPESFYDENSTDWVSLGFIAGYHLLLVILLPLYLMNNTPSWGLIGFSFFLMCASMLAITAGYHRYYAHKTYEAKKPFEWVLLLFGTLAVQGSVYEWAHDHRVHHKFVDTEPDPYNAERGFWFSHLLWMFRERSRREDDRYLKDLLKDKVLQFQDKYYGLCLAAVNVLAIWVAFLISGDLMGAIVIAFLLRLFLSHHLTWFINSLAHMWGAQPYSSEHSAVNNAVLAFLTFGEGYHNFHHTFAGDYRNGVRWYQFDPTKYLIWTASKFGLTSELKRTDTLMIKKRLLLADRKLLLEHLSTLSGRVDFPDLKGQVESMADRISETIRSAKMTMDKYRALDRKAQKTERMELKAKIKDLRSQIATDLESWKALCNQILDIQPAMA